MKRLLAVSGLMTLACCQMASAQSLLSNVSLSEAASATATSIDYRYTKHTISAGGRGGHTSTYYSWDPYIDQSIVSSVPMTLGATSKASATGTFYAPTYSVSVTGLTSLVTNTASTAEISAHFSATTTVTTTLGAHQAVTVSASPGGTISFTLTNYTNVKVTTTGSLYGVFRLFGSGMLLMGPLYGAGTMYYDGSLPPGSYWITTSLDYSSGVDTQQGTSTHPGKSSASFGFTVTFTPGSSDGGGG